MSPPHLLSMAAGRSLRQLEKGAANDSIAHQAADVESVRTVVLIWPEDGREHNGKHGEEHAKLDMELRCRGTKKEGQQLEGNQRG